MKKITITTVVMIILIGLITNGVTYGNTGSKFNDIGSHWAKGNINNLSGLNVITGYPDGSFKPEKSMTKAEFITVMVRSLGDKKVDIFDKEWYTGYLQSAKDRGYLKENNSIIEDEPNEPITRLEAVTTFYNFLDLEKDYDLETYSNPFKDIDNDYASVLANEGVLTGYPDGTFRPNNSTTRAEVLVMLERMYFNENAVYPIDKDSLKTEKELIQEDIEKGFYPTLEFKRTTTDHLGPYLYGDGYVPIVYSDKYETVDFTPYNKEEGFFEETYYVLRDFKKLLQDDLDKVYMWKDWFNNEHEYVVYEIENNRKNARNSVSEPNGIMLAQVIFGKLRDAKDVMNHADWAVRNIQRDTEFAFYIMSNNIYDKERIDFSIGYSQLDNWRENYSEILKNKYSDGDTFNSIKYYEDRYEEFLLKYMDLAMKDEHQALQDYLMGYYPQIKEKMKNNERLIVYAGIGEIRYELSTYDKGIGFSKTYMNVEKNNVGGLMIDPDLNIGLMNGWKNQYIGKYFGE